MSTNSKAMACGRAPRTIACALMLRTPCENFSDNKEPGARWLSIPEMNLGGGIGSGERHLAPGSLLSLKFSHGVRNIKAQAIVRGARPQAMAFEFVDMDLDERYRLRKLLLELGGLPVVAQVTNRTRRRGRVAILRN